METSAEHSNFIHIEYEKVGLILSLSLSLSLSLPLSLSLSLSLSHDFIITF